MNEPKVCLGGLLGQSAQDIQLRRPKKRKTGYRVDDETWKFNSLVFLFLEEKPDIM